MGGGLEMARTNDKQSPFFTCLFSGDGKIGFTGCDCICRMQGSKAGAKPQVGILSSLPQVEERGGGACFVL